MSASQQQQPPHRRRRFMRISSAAVLLLLALLCDACSAVGFLPLKVRKGLHTAGRKGQPRPPPPSPLPEPPPPAEPPAEPPASRMLNETLFTSVQQANGERSSCAWPSSTFDSPTARRGRVDRAHPRPRSISAAISITTPLLFHCWMHRYYRSPCL